MRHLVRHGDLDSSLLKPTRQMDVHGDTPHRIPTYNKHTRRVACETCRIPAFARTLPTMVWWDWSKAGKDLDLPKDQFGMKTYAKTKGEFKWAKEIVPTYRWYNGEAERYLLGDKIDPSK